MPYKNQIKQLIEGGFYRAYNRGHNKQEVFLDAQDYKTYLYIIKKYLDPNFRETKFLPNGEAVQVPVNKPLYDKVELHAYCLMPNHFHLLLKQKTKDSMSKLLNVLGSQYSSYFNEKYKQEGSIWQGTYKAVRIRSEEQYLHVSRYIHLNPMGILGIIPHMRDYPLSKLSAYPYSSYSSFIGTTNKPIWLKPDNILHYFSSQHKKTGDSYKKFVENYIEMNDASKEKEKELIKGAQLD